MKPRSLRRMALALVLALGLTGAFAAIATATETTLPDMISSISPSPSLDASEPPAAPTIVSDFQDYAPGELVILTGTGWQGDTTVNITVNDDAGQTWYYTDKVAVALDGTIRDTFNLPSTFIARYYVTAKGAQTNRTAEWTFTDAEGSLLEALRALVGRTPARRLEQQHPERQQVQLLRRRGHPPRLHVRGVQQTRSS